MPSPLVQNQENTTGCQCKNIFNMLCTKDFIGVIQTHTVNKTAISTTCVLVIPEKSGLTLCREGLAQEGRG